MYQKMLHFYQLVIAVTVLPKYISGKYLEGELKTSDVSILYYIGMLNNYR